MIIARRPPSHRGIGTTRRLTSPARRCTAGAADPAHHAQEDHRAGGSVHRILHRPPGLPASPDAWPASMRSPLTSPLLTQVEEQIAPFAAAVAKLDEITGISLAAAHAVIAESGTPTWNG
jgi:hypothetical protein